ncbi:hypothetical protein CEUSTIGMA_g7506.t1 [Chlamydomonas eustigma]|uniref:Uncharacterized protein n=1 Tax=Chlamydomonas eustigma TaxID=1157962 RepID=A0A250XAG3_9CHLO|nr:hypothetical protein CEUSTIGMA_g7506.t1 [Chlamydomonas eustigma]|eukprot:GAX80068.1 hypothetical protein CEUSTIGMA_g7506.t1 [Chlamydomonas eustigma]
MEVFLSVQEWKVDGSGGSGGGLGGPFRTNIIRTRMEGAQPLDAQVVTSRQEVDEFDALGAARGAQAIGDESASIINELLVQMDGFEDNAGIVLLGATNRPGAIDSALIRPGRFDRILYMPLPDAAGRAKILQVHARDKAVDPNINWYEVARTMAGFTGADCMGLMQRAACMAARQGHEQIEEEDLSYAAMENKSVEAYSEMTGTPKPGQDAGVPDPIPDCSLYSLKRAVAVVAVYEAGKVLTAYITPEFEEVARVSNHN